MARIMIAEDEIIIATQLRKRLILMGHEVSGIASSGKEAIALARDLSPDLILMDIVMPGEQDGIGAAEQIRAEQDIPVVFLTAYADDHFIRKARDVEAFGYLVKPAQEREIRVAIEIALYKHKMERRLREREEWFRTTLSSIGDAVIAANSEGHIQFMNPVAESLTGWSQADAFSRPLSDVLHLVREETGEPLRDLAEQAIKGEPDRSPGEHFILKARNGTEIPVADSAAPIKGEKGGVTGVVLTFRDISARKRAEEEARMLEERLRQSHKMEAIGTLAGGIAHDFNNILGIIIGNTELALTDVPNWNPVRFNLEETRKACLRAKDVVRQLLSFTRQTALRRKPVKIAPLVKEALRLLRSSIPSSIEIRQNLPPDTGMIMADLTQIHQVIINLCSNAAHAMSETGGLIEISLRDVMLDEEAVRPYADLAPGPYVELCVRDTGQGIGPEIMDRIFDPYFTTKEVGKGTGIGLAAVRGIVRGHGGEISVSSEPGKGTTCRVFFPVIPEKSSPEQPVSGSSVPTGTESVLLIDDEVFLADMIRQQLESLGYQAEARTAPLDALEYFRTAPDRFDLVITDMTMPGMTGDRLVQEILEIRSDMPIILCTGFSERITEQRAGELGVRKYLEKPFSRKELAAAIRQVLDERK